MNEDILEGKWKQLVGQVREKWGELTDDDIERVAGKRDRLIGLLQERYGYSLEAAELQVEEFTRDVKAQLGD